MVEKESLFSFEVVVESLENVAVSCVIPAIAFRLLDFPTLVIRRQGKCSDDISYNSTVDGTYLIQSGKSCLFKMDKEVLFSNLERTPLYVMLIDVSTSKAKLLASTTLSLTSCFEQVLKDIEINGLDVPAVHGSRGIFELYNLMGTSVAIVKLSYRIFSLGGTINGHVKTCEPITKPAYSLNNGQPQNITRTKHLKRIPRITEQEDSDSVHDTVVEKRTETPLLIKQLNVETQTDILCNEEPHSLEINKPPLLEINKPQKVKRENINITRPPPLYYNSNSTTIIPQPTTSKQQLSENYPRFFLDKIRVNEGNTTKKYHHTVSVQTDENVEPKNLSESSKQNTETKHVVDLPLINALLRELSFAKQNIMGTIDKTEQPNEIHTDAKKSSGVKFQTKASFSRTSMQEVKRIPPSNKRKTKLPKPSDSKGVLIQRQPLQFKKSAMKRHTTKTQKLREALNRKKRNENAPATPCKVDHQENTARKNVKTTVDAHESKTHEFACQVEIQHSNEKLKKEQSANNEGNQKKSYKEIGVQVVCHDMPSIHVAVQRSDLLQFNKEDFALSSAGTPRSTNSADSGSKQSPQKNGFPDRLSPVSTNMLNTRVPDHIYEDQASPGSNSVWSSHSRKSTSSLVLLAATKPVFSKYSPTPPVTKNSRYTANGSTDTQLTAGVLLRESDFVDKPVIHLSKSTSAEDNLVHTNDSKEDQIIDVLLGESDLVDEPVSRLSNPTSIEYKEDHGPKEAQLADMSLSESDLVDKPVIYLSTSVEQDYSDKFDSFESEHTIESDSK